MKQARNILVVILLVITTGGLSVSRHYCGQSYISFSLFSNPKACCPGDCDKCHNDISFKKVSDNFNTSVTESSKPVITTNLVQSDFLSEISALLLSNHLPIFNTLKKFLFLKTGDFPVSFGNFRC